ncbi:hypothetical protein BH18ACT14_BH18ACT14_18280 [soil metagenome]
MWDVKIRCAFPKNADSQVGSDFWHPIGFEIELDGELCVCLADA